MLAIVVFLLIGAVLGYFAHPNALIMRRIHYAQTAGVVALIALMGFSLGQIPDILDKLMLLGLTGAAFALLSTAGSAVVTYVILRTFGSAS